ncbi:MAG: hypothetical protein QXR13_02830, partial [Candidatus Bathyarchaeia archaeon]
MSIAEESSPRFIRGLWALTARELKKWLNDPVMLIMFILQPLIWMALLGKSMNMNALFSQRGIGSIQLPDLIPVPGNYISPPANGIIYISGKWLSEVLQQAFSKIGLEVMRGTFGVA